MKCSICCKQIIKEKPAYRQGKVLCSKCFQILKGDRANNKQNWEDFMNGKKKYI